MTEHLPQGSEPIAPHLSSMICQVDRIARHAHGLFGYGWALDRQSAISRTTLELRYDGGRTESVQVSMARSREDVAVAFPDDRHAANSGFMLMAGWGDTAPQRITLLFELSDGRTHGVDLNDTPAHDAPRPPLVELRYLLKHAWGCLRQGKLRLLMRKGIRYCRNNLRRRNSDATALAARIGNSPCRLLIDHSMGGGANQFREALVGQWLAASDTVLLVSFKIATMATFVELMDRKGTVIFNLDSLDRLPMILESVQVQQIFFNCAVSFPRPELLQPLMLQIKRRSRAELIVAIHEYFVICPSPFLLDDTGRYCGVPDIKRCDTCLAAHGDGFASLTGERSIRRWRAVWGELLQAADEIRCFSPSTPRLLERAYPHLAGRATVRPHQVQTLRPVRSKRAEQPKLTIGVIGAISQHKGAQVVADLAKAIEDAGAAVQIVIVGTLDATCPTDVVKQTGPYKQDELPRIIEKHKISLALLPSICPETFSFVAHEIVSMQLPLVCLDLGAQADLVRAQPVGLVSPRQDGPGLLAEIMAFDRRLHPLNLRVIS